MKLEFDEIYKKWVVWLIKGNTMAELFKGNKKDCESFIRSQKMKGKKK